MNLTAHIQKLDNNPSFTKHDKIVEGISNCIEEAHLNTGDTLPSINKLSSELGYARETVVKAYNALRERGIVNSKHGLGYFISNDDLNTQMHLALVMYGFQTFQQTFYNTLRKALGNKFKIDVFFHHNNLDVYKSILQNIKLKYGMFVIAPIQQKEAKDILKQFPSKKLLLVDRFQYLDDNVCHVTQEFETNLNSIFEQLRQKLKAFKKVVLFYKEGSDYPEGIKKAFLQFCKNEKLSFNIYDEYESHLLEKQVAYCTVGDGDLWPLIKDAKYANFDIGKDIGILSHNDSPVKEIIEGGITTFSTDFSLMAIKAAEYLKSKKPIKDIVPIKLIIRKSL